MGTIVELRKLKSNQNLFRLLIYSKAPPDLLSNAFSINKLLAAELVKLKPSRRTMQLENCFVKLLERFPNQSVIEERNDALREFRDKTSIFISTDAGGEGLNLQFSNIIINYQ